MSFIEKCVVTIITKGGLYFLLPIHCGLIGLHLQNIFSHLADPVILLLFKSIIRSYDDEHI